MQDEMECLAVMVDGMGLVNEGYKDASSSEHGIYQAYKLALYQNASKPQARSITRRGQPIPVTGF